MMMSDRRICAVTGASGYVGSRLTKHFRRTGWQVIELRRDAGSADVSPADVIPFTLERGVKSARLRAVDLLIHCAYDFRPTRWDHISRINVDGSRKLFRAAREAGISQILNISTMSAFEGCRSLYGRAKLEIEAESRACDAISVRPGLVHGNSPGGTLGALQRVVSLSPVLPLVGHGRYQLYLAHEDDLCRFVSEVSDRIKPGAGESILAAAEEPYTLRQILDQLARRQGRRIVLVPVPSSAILAILRVAETLKVPLGFRSDSLVSLINQDPSPDFTQTRNLGVSFRGMGPRS